jgi:hypothetical protein
MYWANTPTNLDYTPTYETKPSYNSAFGWKNGAQTSAFGAGGSVNPNGAPNLVANSTAVTPRPSPSSGPVIENDEEELLEEPEEEAEVEPEDETEEEPEEELDEPQDDGSDDPTITSTRTRPTQSSNFAGNGNVGDEMISTGRRRPTQTGAGGRWGENSWKNHAAQPSGAMEEDSPTGVGPGCNARRSRQRRHV